jgi:hypothetical protein
MSQLKSKRAPSVDSNQRAWTQVYDDLNDVIKAVNQESGVESRNGAAGKDGDIRLFKDVDRNKFFIEGRFGDGWAKRELLFSDTSEAGQDESINFSATESYIKPDGSVPFTAVQTGVTPTNNNHLATKQYVDSSDGDTTYSNSWVDSGNNALLRLTPSSGSAQDLTITAGNNIALTPSGSSLTIAANVTTTVTSTFTTGTHSGVDLQSLLEDQDKTFAVRAGDNINITQLSLAGGDEYLKIDCAINTNNFLATGVNRVEGVRKHSGDAFDFTQSASSGKYIVIDDDNSNVAVTESTVTLADNSTHAALRLTAPGNTQNVFTSSWVDSSNDCILRLTKSGASSGTQDIKIVAGSNVQLNPSGTNLTISSTDTNTTVVTSTESTGGDFVSLLEDSDTIRALKGGSGINITVEGQADGEDVVQIASTVNTSGLLSSAIVSVQDHDGGSVGNFANASGGDKLEFRDGGNITWNVSGPSNDTITVTGSVPNNTDTNYYLTGLSFNTSTGVLTGTVTGASNPTVDLDGRYLTAHQDISGKANLSGGAAFTGGVSFDGNVSGYPDAVFGGTGRMVDSAAVIQAKGFIRVAQYVLIHQDAASNTGNAVGLTYANNNLSVYASSGTTAEGNGQANFHVPGDVIAYYSSDSRLKTNKKPLENSLCKLSNINGYAFDWLPKATEYNSYNEGSDIGVMADEIEAMYPDLVETRANGYKAVKYEKLTAVLISAVNELTSKLIEKGVLDEEL